MSWVHSAVEGMRNFFGKKVGGFVSSAFAHLSPIGLHSQAEGAKIATSVAPSFADTLRSFRSRFGEVMGSRQEPFRLSNYFRGFNADEVVGVVPEAIRSRRQMTRLALPGLVGLGLGADVAFGSDNAISKMSRTAGSVALATMTGFGLRSVAGGAVAAGFGGLTAINAVRPGDQWGFF